MWTINKSKKKYRNEQYAIGRKFEFTKKVKQ